MMKPALFVLGAAVCATAITVSAQRSGPEARMTDAARAFLASLTPEQKAKATFAFTDDERLNWHFIPRERKGMPLKQMTEPQRKAALALLKTSLSDKGYDQTALIRDLEIVLKELEKGRQGPVRDPEQYFFTVFGEPSDTGTWGWRYEGHHCAQNWTLVKGKLAASSPQFFGTNPAEVRVDVPGGPPKGTRVLAAEEDLARQLVNSLDEQQRKMAIVSETAPNDIATAASRVAAIQADTGIPYRSLKPEQQEMMRNLVLEYINKQNPELAQSRIDKVLAAGPDGVKFAWMGSTQPNQGHYYRVQGPTFLIEYDNTQNNANHVHAVWRDFKGDFGMDLLAMHYQASHRKVAAAK